MLFWVCLVIVIGQAAFAVITLRHYMALPGVPTVPRRLGMPRVSIIIPARNEAANLGRLLPSLLNLDYGSYEIIVVDDASTDATTALAGEFDAITVRSGGPPPGWTGKTYACHLGAMAATGEWLLFTDADTEHAALSLASLLGFALDRHLDALSVFPGHDCASFWERVMVPFAFQQFFAGVPGADINNPREPSALANGQYFLIRRDVYDRVGGHDAVRGSIVEDVSLAHLIKARGARYAAARAEHLVFVRMYRGLTEIWQAFSKNSYQFLSLDPRRGFLVVVSAILAGLTPTLVSLGLKPGNDAVMMLAVYSYAFLALGLMGWDRLFRVPIWYGLLQPLSVLLFALSAIYAGARSLLGRGVVWKGRVYGRRQGASVPTDEPSRPRQRREDENRR